MTTHTVTGVAFQNSSTGEVFRSEGFDGGHAELAAAIIARDPSARRPDAEKWELGLTWQYEAGFATSDRPFVRRGEALRVMREQYAATSAGRNLPTLAQDDLTAENVRDVLQLVQS